MKALLWIAPFAFLTAAPNPAQIAANDAVRTVRPIVSPQQALAYILFSS